MFTNLTIQNFKSIKFLSMDCRRVNLFIGEPNTGKSNILEALGLISYCAQTGFDSKLKEYIRFEHIQDMYYDGMADKSIKIGLSGGEPLMNTNTH